MASKIHVEFIDTEYRFSHGAAPRGRGSWAFSTERDSPIEQVWFSMSMTFGEAKRAAAKYFRAKLIAESSAPLCGQHASITIWVQP